MDDAQNVQKNTSNCISSAMSEAQDVEDLPAQEEPFATPKGTLTCFYKQTPEDTSDTKFVPQMIVSVLKSSDDDDMDPVDPDVEEGFLKAVESTHQLTGFTSDPPDDPSDQYEFVEKLHHALQGDRAGEKDALLFSGVTGCQVLHHDASSAPKSKLLIFKGLRYKNETDPTIGVQLVPIATKVADLAWPKNPYLTYSGVVEEIPLYGTPGSFGNLEHTAMIYPSKGYGNGVFATLACYMEAVDEDEFEEIEEDALKEPQEEDGEN